MQAKIKKQVRQALLRGPADSVTIKRDDSIVVKRGYFYRHTQTVEGFAMRCQAALKDAGIETHIEKKSDHWNVWPRDSWFEATLRLASWGVA